MMNITLLILQMFVVTLTLFCGCAMLLTMLSNRKMMFFDPKPTRFPTVTIGVPAYNKAKEIGATLKSLLALDYPVKPEIIVVDDASTDGTADVVRKFAGVKLIQLKKNSGHKAVPLNVALKNAKGELFGFIDADTIMHKDALKSMVGYFSDVQVAAVMPAMNTLPGKGILVRLQRIEYMITILSRKVLTFLNALFLTPGCALFRTEVLRLVGGFDEHDITEDLEIGLRLKRAGWRIENSLNAVVWTGVPESFKAVTRQRVRWYRGMIQNLRRYHDLIGQKSDLGVFVIPFLLLGGAIGIVVFASAMIYIASNALLDSFNFVSALALSGWDLSLLDLSYLSFQPNIFMFLSVLFILIFGTNFYFSTVAARQSKTGCLVDAIIFILIYTPLVGFWWVLSVVQEAVGADNVW